MPTRNRAYKKHRIQISFSRGFWISNGLREFRDQAPVLRQSFLFDDARAKWNQIIQPKSPLGDQCHQIYSVISWISNGLRLFWDQAPVLRLAAVAFSKQYCLSEAEVRGGASCIAWASRETGAPK